MESSQIIVYGVLAFMLVLYGRKAWYRRSIKNYTPSSLKEAMSNPSALLLLDVRSDKEHRQGTIRGSMHIPLHHLVRRMDELEKHKSKEIVCFCQTGSRSINAAIRLKKYGFTVANLEGGMSEWNFETHR